MSIWSILLILVTFLLFLIPLLPGIMELIRPTDIEPLRVSQDYDSNPYHFADGFRKYVNTHFGDIRSTQNQNARLQDDTRYQLVGEKGIPNLDATSITNKLILSAHPLTLPSGELFETEIYGRQNVMTGERSHFRALLSESTLHLRDHCTILRWAHSENELMVGRHCRLYGRATSKSSIILADEVRFERLHAPIIITTVQDSPSFFEPDIKRTTLEELPDVKIHSGRRWVLNNHLDFPAFHAFDGDIITGTTATIGEHAHIKGSIKCNAYDDVAYHLQSSGVPVRSAKKVGHCELGAGVQVDGSIISTHDLLIGPHCKIYGPVIAENKLIIGTGTTIGSPTQPTTVKARSIIIESGCTIYGTLWATEEGYVSVTSTQSEAA